MLPFLRYELLRDARDPFLPPRQKLLSRWSCAERCTTLCQVSLIRHVHRVYRADEPTDRGVRPVTRRRNHTAPVRAKEASRKRLGEDFQCFPDFLVRGERFFFFFQAEDGIRDVAVTGVQTCALPI